MTPKPESETDPWAKVRTFDVSTYGPGVLGGGAWSAKAAIYLAKEVDAARAAEAAQHRREVAALEHEAEHEHAVATAREGYVKTLEAERDRLKAALNGVDGRIVKVEQMLPGMDIPGPERHSLIVTLKGWRQTLRAALTPQGQSTDGETK